MSTTNFTDGVTLSSADWFNDVDALTYEGTFPTGATAVKVTGATTLAVFNTIATTVNAFGAASVALNIGHASAAAAFPGGIAPAKLVDISGAAAGQVKFPASQNASANANTLDDYAESSTTVALSGCTTAPAGTYYATKIGNQVTIDFWPGATVTATSNSASKGFTAIAAPLRPTSAKRTIVHAADNGGSYVACTAILNTDGTLTLSNGLNSGTWTASGTFTVADFSMTYTMN